MKEPIIVNIDNNVAYISINRPEKHNAFDDLTIKNLTDVFKKVSNNIDVRLVVINSVGKTFSAGADLNWMQKQVNYSIDENINDAKELTHMLATLANIPQPTIAQVQGAAYGGALGIIAACDVAIATESSRFCLSEVKLGLSPAIISPYIINAIGKRVATEWMLTAKVISATEAKASNLVHSLCKDDELVSATNELVNNMLTLGPKALIATKALIAKVANTYANQDINKYCCELIAKLRVSDEGQEGLRAFLEKRKAKWLIS